MVQRQSDKTGPRLDEQRKGEVESLVRGAPAESHAEEDRLQEDAGPGEPTPDMGHHTRQGDDQGIGISEEAAEARAELARHLRLSAFPADRDALMAVANDEHAPDAVLAMLRRLPPGQEFETVQDVWAMLGGPTEGTHT